MFRILVLDDDIDILNHCRRLLELHGYEVVTLTSPRDAQALLLAQNFDLAIIDVVMPRISGFELLKKLRASGEFNTPVMMLTSRRTPRDVMTALELGAIDYLCKPIDRTAFQMKVHSILHREGFGEEVELTSGSPESKAVLTLEGVVERVALSGVTLRLRAPVSANSQVALHAPVFKDMGLGAPMVRVERCRSLEDGSERPYEAHVGFIGLDEAAAEKLRRWLTFRSAKAAA